MYLPVYQKLLQDVLHKCEKVSQENTSTREQKMQRHSLGDDDQTF